MAYVSRFTGQQIDEAIDEMHNNKVVCDLKKLDTQNAKDGMLLVFSDGKFILGNPEDFGGGDGAPGADGIGIQSIEQTLISEEDGGLNEVEVTLTDGTKKTLYIRNGSKGSTGATGANGPAGNNGKDGKDGTTPVKGVDYFTDAEIQNIVDLVVAQVGTGGGTAAELQNAMEVSF